MTYTCTEPCGHSLDAHTDDGTTGPWPCEQCDCDDFTDNCTDVLFDLERPQP